MGAIVNMALFVNGKVPVNLNYTLSEQSMALALKKANIQQVITSEKFLTKLSGKGFDYQALLADKAVMMEELGKAVSKHKKRWHF
ncbi:2-acyl-glycerophospho-ethanolamine acyltransferase [Aggregatibacter aphrophilus]|uniref:2-acyl-glycerophospho-ethanolamine acyltransferase n=1 Tax=Aggregatibacter aphrophilus TaxID=732 RepID=A0A336N9P3_AGGAP|nr:2-acyl-glycerophospho-ethanolamine acyltransferase [Aggregatibacter aphrophilus]